MNLVEDYIEREWTNRTGVKEYIKERIFLYENLNEENNIIEENITKDILYKFHKDIWGVQVNRRVVNEKQANYNIHIVPVGTIEDMVLNIGVR